MVHYWMVDRWTTAPKSFRRPMSLGGRCSTSWERRNSTVRNCCWTVRRSTKVRWMTARTSLLGRCSKNRYRTTTEHWMTGRWTKGPLPDDSHGSWDS